MVESTQQDRVSLLPHSFKLLCKFDRVASSLDFSPLKGWRHCFSSYLADPTDTFTKTAAFSILRQWTHLDYSSIARCATLG